MNIKKQVQKKWFDSQKQMKNKWLIE